MWIILEGPDGAGKTTLHEIIVRQTAMSENVTPTHMHPPRDADSALAEVVAEPPFSTYRPGGSTNSIVSDRHHWGCPVYGPLYRPDHDDDGYGDFGKHGWRYSELFCLSRGAVTFLVTVDPEVARERIGVRGDDFIDVAHLENICDTYRHVASDSVTHVATFDNLFIESYEKIAIQMRSIAARCEAAASSLNPWPDYVGSPRPQRLFIVDSEPGMETVFELLRAMNGEWMTSGIVSSNHTFAGLERLVQTLDPKHVYQIGRAHDAAAVTYQCGGTIVPDVESALSAI